MKIIFIVCFAVLLFLFSYKMYSKIHGCYDYMHFERMGGGQIDFKIYQTGNKDKLKVIVNKFNFRDTTIQMLLDSNTENMSAFLTFNKSINNQVPLNGKIKQTTLMTGTWVHIYFVAKNKEIEVTNLELRDKLLIFEKLVKEKIQ